MQEVVMSQLRHLVSTPGLCGKGDQAFGMPRARWPSARRAERWRCPRCCRAVNRYLSRPASSYDSPLEGDGFEPSVPPSTRRPSKSDPRATTDVSRDDLGFMIPSSLSVRHLCSAEPRGPFRRAVPMVRIRFPPPVSQRRTHRDRRGAAHTSPSATRTPAFRAGLRAR